MKFELSSAIRIHFSVNTSIDLLLSGTSYPIKDNRIIDFILWVDEPKEQADIEKYLRSLFYLSANESLAKFSELTTLGLLVPEGTEDNLTEDIQRWVDRGWLEALVYHLKTRNIVFEDMLADGTRVRDAFLEDLASEPSANQLSKSFPNLEYTALPICEGHGPEYNFFETLLRRRSNGPWRNTVVELSELSWILYETFRETRDVIAVIQDSKESHLSRQAFLYSSVLGFETYVFVFDVQGLESGLYHYNHMKHSLARIARGDSIKLFCDIAIGQQNARGAGFGLLFTGVWQRFQIRYQHERAYRNMMVHIGELMQKVLLLAAEKKFGMFLTPALKDHLAAEALDFTIGVECPLYVVALG